MSENEQPKKKKSLLWRIIKWSLILLVFLYVILTVLSRLGGDSPILKEAIQDYISNESGWNARIGKLNAMTFFPDISVDFQGLIMEKPSEDIPFITASNVKIAFRFVDVIFGGKRIKDLEIFDVNIPKGAIDNNSYILKSAVIENAEDEQSSSLKAMGSINDHPISLDIELDQKGSALSPYYQIKEQNPLTLNVGDITITSTVDTSLSGKSEFQDITVSKNAKEVLFANLSLKRQDTRSELVGDVKTAQHNSDFSFDLTSEQQSLTGQISGAKLSAKDLSEDASVMRTVNTLRGLFNQNGVEKFTLPYETATVKIDLKALETQGLTIEGFKAKTSIENQVLRLHDMTGTASKGSVSGEVSLNAQENPAALNADIKIKNFDYGAYQRSFKQDAQIDGKADIAIKLESAGLDAPSIRKNIQGEVSFVGGKGKMRTGLLDFWGGGLLNALLPSFEKEDEFALNCVVADFKIKDGVAEADALFVDTTRITLSGEGRYDIRNDKVDLKLTPKPKEVAIGSLGSGVVLSGPLGDMSVTPSVLDLSKKIGSLLLSAVNPAFLAVSLADLGLNDDHPCKQFVIEKENLAPPEPQPENTELQRAAPNE